MNHTAHMAKTRGAKYSTYNFLIYRGDITAILSRRHQTNRRTRHKNICMHVQFTYTYMSSYTYIYSTYIPTHTHHTYKRTSGLRSPITPLKHPQIPHFFSPLCVTIRSSCFFCAFMFLRTGSRLMTSCKSSLANLISSSGAPAFSIAPAMLSDEFKSSRP